MKRENIFALTIMILVSAFSIEANAQGRGRGNGHAYGHDKRNKSHHDDRHHDRHERYSYDRHDRHDHHDHHNHHVHRPVRHVYHHHHSHSCSHHVVVHHCEQPRYIYYRDYDVYYDNTRHVYISYSGRNWSITAGIPVHMRHVDVHHVGYTEVQYYDDDFVSYLDQGQPIYGKFYARR